MAPVFAGAFIFALWAGLAGAMALVDIDEFDIPLVLDMLLVFDIALDCMALPSAIAAPPSISPVVRMRVKVFTEVSLGIERLHRLVRWLPKSVTVAGMTIRDPSVTSPGGLANILTRGSF
jgi:hypothetical protein